MNYLPLFDVSEFLRREKPADVGSVEGVDHRIVTQLLLTAGYQSRVGSIWKQSAAMVAVGRAFLPVDHPSLAYYRLLLGPFDAPPFFERGEGLVWVATSPVNSVLPLLLHGAGQLVILSLLDVLAPIDCLACIQHWMTCLTTGFQDTKLSTQKALRNWLPLALNQLPPQKVPIWSLVGDLTGWQLKTTTEHPLVLAECRAQHLESAAKLSPETRAYLSPLQAPTTFAQLMRGYHIGRAMANDGTFFGSLPEVTIDAAVLPRTQGRVLNTLEPLHYS